MQITIQKMWPLKAGRTSGGFKGTDGTNYYCEIPIYHMLSEGMTIDAPAEKYVSKAGKTSYILAKAWTPNGQQAPQPNVPAQTWAQAQAPNGQASPAPPRPAGNGHTDKTAMQIFVTGIVGRAMGSGKFGIDDIPELTRKAREAWDLHG